MYHYRTIFYWEGSKNNDLNQTNTIAHNLNKTDQLPCILTVLLNCSLWTFLSPEHHTPVSKREPKIGKRTTEFLAGYSAPGFRQGALRHKSAATTQHL